MKILAHPNFQRWLKWLLLILVTLLIFVNYFAFTELLLRGFAELNNIMNSHGYYFDITKPLTFIFNLIIPSLGVIGYVVTLSGKNVVNGLKGFYEVITMEQLIVLTLLLPVLLFVQNKFYGKIINNYGAK